MEYTPDLFQYPDYTLPENAGVEQLRATVVRAMHDELSVQWTTDCHLEYRKFGAVSGKLFQYDPDNLYAGLPYSNGSTGIFQWLKYYDKETGAMKFPGTGQQWADTLGNSCANSVIWGWQTVCTGLAGNHYTRNMTQCNGFLPVGPYTYDPNLYDLKEYTTKQIIDDNGAPVMLESYACIEMGDGLVSSTDDHAVMAIEKATTVRLEDGSVDGENSFVMIQDQRGGKGAGFYEREENDKLVNYSGRTAFKYTFNKLMKLGYIPCAPAELLGKKPYQKPWVTYVGNKRKPAELMLGEIRSNYFICNLEAVLECEDGTEKELAFIHYRKGSVGPGVPERFQVLEMRNKIPEDIQKPEDGKKYFFRLDATVANGEKLTAVRIEM